MYSPPNRCNIHHGRNQDGIYDFHAVEHQDKYHNETSDLHESNSYLQMPHLLQ